MTWKEEMMYKIKIDYSTTVEYNNFDDFTNMIGMLMHGGVKKFEVEETENEEEA
jgi:hypothetical protein